MDREEKILPEKTRAPNPATEQEIRAVLGPLDDEMVFIIHETGASKGEVLQAFSWFNGDDYMGAKLKRPMNSRVSAVYEILSESQGETRER